MISIFRCIYKKAFLSPGGDYLQYEERRKEEGGTARLKRRFQSSNLLPEWKPSEPNCWFNQTLKRIKRQRSDALYKL